MKKLLWLALLIPAIALGQEVGSYPNATSPLTGTERILADQAASYPCTNCTVNITPLQLASFAAQQATSYALIYNNNGAVGSLIPGATGQYCLNWTALNAAPTLVTCSSSGTVSSGTAGQLAYYASNGNTVSGETTITCVQMAALTGDVTNSGCATTVSKVNGAAVPASAALLATNGSSQPITVTAYPTAVPLTGYATASLPTCGSSQKGEMAYTTDGTPAFTFCNGTSWVNNGGTTFTMAGTGCTPTGATGDATGGSFTLAAGPCTAVTITFNGAVGMTAGHIWVCTVEDETLQAAGTWFGEWGNTPSGTPTTTTVIPIPAAAGATDTIYFSCDPH